MMAGNDNGHGARLLVVRLDQPFTVIAESRHSKGFTWIKNKSGVISPLCLMNLPDRPALETHAPKKAEKYRHLTLV